LHRILNSLNKSAKSNLVVFNKRYEELSNITSLIDPNKFPIFSLIDMIDNSDIVSVWDYKHEVIENVRKLVGFVIREKSSKIEHHASGRGVFLDIYRSAQN